ncbi:TIGR01244 family phosphatase [Erythrobacteraceae bacterium CFH 75059]|uniref:TIGR01244 family sulfur transferase n=1 Tax=Qipengyuania thermophila TaxID=2509361 RepID=UPI00102031D2|nr:TIGR01244 family sulfur transferase [Qipengyuania thermophila]TCD06830.1 TIGR01244 family phosphatase [Erythrobacteraceae bacterium CFH 75059]
MNPHQIAPGILVSGQIGSEDMPALRAMGVRLIVNNRPDGESADQPAGAVLEECARQHGLRYAALPVRGGTLAAEQADALGDLLAGAEGKVLLFCRSGTRSALLWAAAQLRAGRSLHEVEAALGGVGVDTAQARGLLLQAAEHTHPR